MRYSVMLSPAIIFTLFASVLVSVPAVQVPLGFTGSSRHRKDESQTIFCSQDLAEWSLDKLPNPNDTDHLVFETVHSLLQHWPNTRMRNGHNIVPGVIGKGTLLYHGTLNGHGLPSGPDWVAVDPEHALIFCVDSFGSLSPQPCSQITLATARPLKVVYFDGTSAANMPTGTVDAQQLLVWGRSYNGTYLEEQRMILDLCEWGKNFGVDGFVRMEMDFEIMICDFTASLNVITFANLVSRGPITPMQPEWITFEVVESGSWHNHIPGETRIQLDLAGLVSFYDTQLAPSLVSVRADQERWDHRVRDISKEDLEAVKSRLEAVLVRPWGPSSGIDWKALIHTIVDRFARRLELTRHLLNSLTTNPVEMLHLASKIQAQLRVVLAPYILFSATPTDPSNKTDLDWTRPIYKLCATIHTAPMESDLDSMTDSERVLLRAVRGTSREICRVMTRVWAAGVYAGIDPSLNRKEYPDIAEISRVWNTWVEELDRLMAWLDWSVWVKCNPICGPEEMCYLPTWPIGFPEVEIGHKPPFLLDPDGAHHENQPNFVLRSLARKAHAEEIGKSIMPEQDEWVRPQPRCIRQIAPREF